MPQQPRARVAVNGYGVIGKRVADAIALQDDMELVGIADVAFDWRIRVAADKGYAIFAAAEERENEVLDAFRASSRIALVEIGDGLSAINAVKGMMADLGRPHDNLYEVALWADMLKVEGDELFYAYMVDNQAIVIPDTIDAIGR